MGKGGALTDEAFSEHRKVATQLEAVYTEIEKLAKKKPTEEITALISRKVNHLIAKVREQVRDDEFLDAIEPVPVDSQRIRFDEALIILGELRSAMDREWNAPQFKEHRKQHSPYTEQLMK